MDYQNIRREMDRITITFERRVIDEVVAFLNSYYSRNPVDKQAYQVAAATAIICESIKIPTLNHSRTVGSGIYIENVMKHIGDLSKEQFLSTLKLMADQSRHENNVLLEKIARIALCFRIFKKFKEVFKRLCKNIMLPLTISENLMQFYWIIFLLLKKYFGVLGDVNESTKILAIIIESIFSKKLERSEIISVIQLNQNFPTVNISSEHEKRDIIKQMNYLIQKVQDQRNFQQYFQNQNFQQNPIILERFIDDLSDIYEKEFSTLPDGQYVNEILFLELSKDITPLFSIPRKMDAMKTGVIKFDSDDWSEEEKDSNSFEMEEEQESNQGKQSDKQEIEAEVKVKKDKIQFNEIKLFSSPSFGQLEQYQPSVRVEMEKQKPTNYQPIELTPVSKGMSKQNWIKSYMQSYQVPEVEKKFQQIIGGQEFQSMKSFCHTKISQQIQRMTNHAEKIEKQKVGIWNLFLTILKDFNDYDKNQSMKKSNIQKTFQALLCLCGCLYNHAVRALNKQFQQYCQIYEVSIIDFLEAIAEVKRRLDFPVFIKEYFHEIEKEILIKEIWEIEGGYELLIQQMNSKWIKKLMTHAYSRIREVNESLKGPANIVSKVDELLKHVVNERPRLLYKNQLDHLIICCFLAILSANEERNMRIIANIYQKYKMTSFFSEKYAETTVSDENLQLIKFYNCCFLNQLHEFNHGEKFSRLKEEQIAKFKAFNVGHKELPPVSKIANPFSQPREMKIGKRLNIGSKKEQQALQISRLYSFDQQDEGENDREIESPTFGNRRHRRSPLDEDDD